MNVNFLKRLFCGSKSQDLPNQTKGSGDSISIPMPEKYVRDEVKKSIAAANAKNKADQQAETEAKPTQPLKLTDENLPSDANAPLPRILLVGKNPDPKTFFSRIVLDSLAEAGLDRKDIAAEYWQINRNRSCKCIQTMEDLGPENKRQEMLVLTAIKLWGERCFENTAWSIRKLEIPSLNFECHAILMLKLPKNAEE